MICVSTETFCPTIATTVASFLLPTFTLTYNAIQFATGFKCQTEPSGCEGTYQIEYMNFTCVKAADCGTNGITESYKLDFAANVPLGLGLRTLTFFRCRAHSCATPAGNY